MASFTLGLAQCAHPANGDSAALAAQWIGRAADAGVDLLVFPESLMTRYEESQERFLAAAETIDGPFASAVRAAAAQAGIWVVFTMNERSDNEGAGAQGAAAPDLAADAAHASAAGTSRAAAGLPFNTAVVADDHGSMRAAYRKVHLFDAQGHHESQRMSAGSVLPHPVATPFGMVGVGICYDLRFPEVSRALALAGAQVLLYPAAWVDGTLKTDQWQTLLRARAIENGVFVAGCCRCDEGYVGSSCVFAPDGGIAALAGHGEELLVCDIDLDAVDVVRAATPSLEHRRPDLY